MADTRWYTEARFGMFIHWGLYSNPGGIWKGEKTSHPYSEWLQASEQVPREEYRALMNDFNPQSFNAEEWIKEAANAGMRYFLITAKHHDGFCLWPTKASGYNVMETPCKRDLLGELTEACKKYDIKIGFYYSHWLDWDGTGGEVDFAYMENDEYVHPSDEEYQAYWENKCLAQVSELIDAYDPTFFWFDTWSEDAFEKLTDERLNQLIGLIREKSPDCLINSRINFKNPPDDVDYISTNDNQFPDQGFDKPWETSGTLNHSWAYHKLDFDWKSTEQLLRYLIGNAALGGNYQLNVGPTGDGLFQPAAIKRLREIGSWMAVNSESIYGTEAGPTGKTSWGASTQKGDVVYLHLCDVQAGMALRVEELSSVNHITVLETGEQLTFTQDENALWVNLPKGLSGLQIPVLKLV